MAEGMPSLSNEILDNILSHSSKQVLRQTRLVSREMCAISTVYLFHHLHFDVTAETEEDVGSFRNILATKYLVSSVRELSFESPLRRDNIGNVELGMSKAVRDALDDLCKIQRLFAINIDFYYDSFQHDRYIKKTIIFRTDTLASVLTPLMIPQSPKIRIQRLYMRALQAYDKPDLTESVQFSELISELHYLKLSIHHAKWPPEWPSPKWFLPGYCVKFFNTLPNTFLRPACQTLKCVYLGAGLHWGWHPKVDFRHIHFPHLESLALGFFIFSHDWQLEWLLSHAKSLRYLRLGYCDILAFANPTPNRLDSDGYLALADAGTAAPIRNLRRFEGRWCHYYRAFADALPRLRLSSLHWTPLMTWQDFFDWKIEGKDIHAVRNDEVDRFRTGTGYKAYSSGKFSRFFNPSMEIPCGEESPNHWEELKRLQLNEDTQALLGLLGVIEKRNTTAL